MLNKIGSNIDPCGTPKFIILCDENFSFTRTYGLTSMLRYLDYAVFLLE